MLEGQVVAGDLRSKERTTFFLTDVIVFREEYFYGMLTASGKLMRSMNLKKEGICEERSTCLLGS